MTQVGYSRRSMSYYHLPRSTPVVYQSVPDIVKAWARTQPDKEAIVIRFPGRERQVLTYAQLNHKATALALQLSYHGVGVGHRVAIFVQNSLEWAISEIGVMYAGATVVNLMTYKGRGILDSASSLGCTAFILDVRHVTADSELSEISEACQFKPDFTKILIQQDTQLNNCLDFDDLLNSCTPNGAELPPIIDPDSICGMWPTSGSTGMSKYVPHTHMSVVDWCITLSRAIGMNKSDVCFQERPMGYIMGFPVGLVCCGTTNIYVDSKLSVGQKAPDFVVDVMTEESVTAAFMPSYLLIDMDRLSKEGKTMPRFRTGVVYGQRLDIYTKSVYQRLGQNLHFVYGTNESLGNAVSLHDDINWGKEIFGLNIFPGLEVKVIGDDGMTVPLGDDGEICLRGPTIGHEYFREDMSVEPIRDSVDWFHTEDVGTLQADGYMTVKGRTKEIIKRATVKIFPASIEGILMKHHYVEDVIVVGVPNIRLHEEVCVFVSTKKNQYVSEAEVRSFAEGVFQPDRAADGKGLMPDYFMIMDELPRLPSSKPDLVSLKKEAIVRIKLDQTEMS